jgi:predicted enzyme related to lactoylglutathione lyase
MKTNRKLKPGINMKSQIASVVMLAVTLIVACAADGVSRDPQPAFRITKLRHVTIFVRDYEEALRWYTNKLGFAKVEDRVFGNGQRWLVVAPAGQMDVGIVLAKDDTSDKGGTSGKHVERVGATKYWVFDTDDCQKSYEALTVRGVKFTRPPQKLPWGTQAEFLDLYGNEFVLLSTNQH